MQILLGETEQKKMVTWIQDALGQAKPAMDRRMEKNRTYHQKWRAKASETPDDEEGGNNFQVGLLQATLLNQLSENYNSLWGDGAGVKAIPVGEADVRTAHKVSRFASWRWFSSMPNTRPRMALFDFRRTLFGRSFMLRDYHREEYMIRTPEGEDRPAVWYWGPRIIPLRNSDVITPAEEVESVQDFTWVGRRVTRVTVAELLAGEGKKYVRIRERLSMLLDTAPSSERGHDASVEMSEPAESKDDDAEGLGDPWDDSKRDRGIEIIEMTFRWRFPRSRRLTVDVGLTDWQKRREVEDEVIAYYCPRINDIIGLEDLRAIYPTMRDRRPMESAGMLETGRFYGPGLGELLEAIDDQQNELFNTFLNALAMQIGPMIFYRQGSGFRPANFKYKPFTAQAVADPQSVNMMTMKTDLGNIIVAMEHVQRFGERVSGVNDFKMGRPDQVSGGPTTATGQLDMTRRADLRSVLNLEMMKEAWKPIIRNVFMLDQQPQAPKSIFFRVTEEEARGLFDVTRGGAQMTDEERGGRFDFDLKFSPNGIEREAAKARVVEAYGLVREDPLYQTNPALQAGFVRAVLVATENPDLADLIQAPPVTDMPLTPEREWTLMLQGEEVRVHPMDNDQAHLAKHYKQEAQQRALPPEQRDPEALAMLEAHMLETHKALRDKALKVALVQQIADEMEETGPLIEGELAAAGEDPSGEA
jgi:hypothetical protein